MSPTVTASAIDAGHPDPVAGTAGDDGDARGGSTFRHSDARLLLDFRRRRDEASFRQLYRRHTGFLYRYCLGRLRDPEQAESVVQETWMRATRAIDRFDGSSALRSWLVGIARNCCREHVRARARLLLVDDADAPARAAEAPSPGGGAPDVDLERAVAGLPERARAVLLLHDVEGCTHAEIGAILEIDPGTSKSQLSRARRLLRRALSTGDDHEPV